MSITSASTRYVYVVRCRDGCYYVGVTESPARRLAEHRAGTGSAWTKLHPAVAFDRPCRRVQSDHDEDNLTKDYMNEYGIDKVRGGTYSNVNLTKSQRESLNLVQQSRTGSCFKCGQPGHFSRDCRAHVSESKSSTCCDRCGRTSHDIAQCFASTAVGGIGLGNDWQPSSRESCDRCGRESHEASKCYATTDINGFTLDGDNSDWRRLQGMTESRKPQSIQCCHRCGRESHQASQCYASTNVNGAALIEEEEEPYIDSSAPDSVTCFRCGVEGHYANECRGRGKNKRAASSSEGIYKRAKASPSKGNYKGAKYSSSKGNYMRSKASSSIMNYYKGTKALSSKGNCFRCGGKGHWASDCFLD